MMKRVPSGALLPTDRRAALIGDEKQTCFSETRAAATGYMRYLQYIFRLKVSSRVPAIC